MSLKYEPASGPLHMSELFQHDLPASDLENFPTLLKNVKVVQRYLPHCFGFRGVSWYEENCHLAILPACRQVPPGRVFIMHEISHWELEHFLQKPG